ncbi:MAG: fumarate hydratase C-terminal domain-containing protein [Endomicrobiia bacterium]
MKCFNSLDINSYKIFVPIKDLDVLFSLKVKNKVVINGEILVFRDQVHKKIASGDMDGISKDEFLNSAVYYCAATEPKSNFVVGSCGPTSSYRMDKYTESILSLGVKIMIGKGYRNADVVELCKKYSAVYLITYGGCGALISKWVKEAKIIGFSELGVEAMYKYKVENFEAIVAIDAYGNTLW